MYCAMLCYIIHIYYYSTLCACTLYIYLTYATLIHYTCIYAYIGITYLANNCRNLNNIRIYHCRDITNQSIYAISQYCIHLQSIDITSCRDIDDTGIIKLAQSCIYITKFIKQNCLNITNNSINILLQYSNINIKYIDLSDCKLINITVLIPLLVIHASSLQQIDIRGCTQITTEHILYLIYNHNSIYMIGIRKKDIQWSEGQKAALYEYKWQIGKDCIMTTADVV